MVLEKSIKQLNRVSISISFSLGLGLVLRLGLVLGVVVGLVLGLVPSSHLVLESTVISSSCVPKRYSEQVSNAYLKRFMC